MKVNPLTREEDAHLAAFTSTRPGWRVGYLGERMIDEDVEAREHKYARAHPYITGMHYVLQTVLERKPTRVLDIGSPLAQNVALSCLPGVAVTVMDVRPHEDADRLGLDWVLGTATNLPFQDGSQDFVTSMWVMGHVGDGRYGDALVVDGDRRMVRELARVLSPGGIAILGPGLIDEECANIFNLHRIYSWEWLRAEFARAGLKVLEERELFVANDVYIDEALTIARRREGRYGVALLRKT